MLFLCFLFMCTCLWVCDLLCGGLPHCFVFDQESPTAPFKWHIWFVPFVVYLERGLNSKQDNQNVQEKEKILLVCKCLNHFSIFWTNKRIRVLLFTKIIFHYKTLNISCVNKLLKVFWFQKLKKWWKLTAFYGIYKELRRLIKN